MNCKKFTLVGDDVEAFEKEKIRVENLHGLHQNDSDASETSPISPRELYKDAHYVSQEAKQSICNMEIIDSL